MEGSPRPRSSWDVSQTPEHAQLELDRLRAEVAAARAARDMAFDELVSLQEAVNRVTALCDMAEWAADVADSSAGPVVANVQDVRAALRLMR